MSKKYTSLGLMSGTSGDGIDASIISSNGDFETKQENKFNIISNEYFEYDKELFDMIHELKYKIKFSTDLKKNEKLIDKISREITLFHANVIQKISKTKNIDIIGFHGHTIFHSPKEKISKQIGDANLLHQLTKKKIVYNFREKDIQNNGEGAPLAPLFHLVLALQKKIELPWLILNIGGISNCTAIFDNGRNKIAKDIGPGNCLIDEWIRNNTKFKFDNKGKIAASGSINKMILEQALEREDYHINKRSFDISDFDLGFVRGLSLEDGAATLVEFTAQIISNKLNILIKDNLKKNEKKIKIILSGGGRKNNYLVQKIKNKINYDVSLIDEYNIDGDFVESQAFAYIAIRSFLNLPITYRWMTGCKDEYCLGGEIIDLN